jgi:DNA-binding protein HU-beta
MTKGDLIESVARALRSVSTRRERPWTTFDNIASDQENKRFQVPTSGLYVASRKARKGRNPQTGAVINIKASRT